MNNNPIGIFDSGVGGLTIWDELRKNLANENFIYLADSKNCPYGEKSQEEIRKLAKINTDFLLSKGCKLIIIACNTATAAAIDVLRANYAVPFIGMEPAIKPAALNTKTGRIGVLATKGTFNGKLFKETSAKYSNEIETFIQVGEGLVELVEKNEINSLESKTLLKKYISPMLEKGIDKIVLGCTHYPFFINEISKITPSNIEIINPAPAIANRTKNILKENNLSSNYSEKSTEFYTNGDVTIIAELVEVLSGLKPSINKFINSPYTS